MTKFASSLIAITITGLLSLICFSCDNDDNLGPAPVINRFYPSSGVIGTPVTIYGDQFIPTVAPEEGTGPHLNTSIVAFNGIVAEAEYVYQDSIGKQRINTIVPDGATSGKITVTANGIMASSLDEFMITVPDYLPNVIVTTAAGYGGTDVAIDSKGNLYVTNNDRFEIVKINPDGDIQTLWSSADTAPNEMPLGIAVDVAGNVFATVTNYIIKISPDGVVSTLAGSTDYGYSDGQGASARFYFPWGIALDDEGNVYIADLLNNKIRKITSDGMVSTLAGSTRGFTDGQGTNAQFGSPIDITLDEAGNIYVTDGRIRKISSSGLVSTIAGTSRGYLDGPTAEAQFNGPRGIAVDAAGNLYICDSNNFVVRRIAPDGTVVTVAGTTFGNVDGMGSSAKFGQTLGLTMDASGAMYLTRDLPDTRGRIRIRKIEIN